ncbi:MAG: DUF4440 domain-containing protein [Acidobacteriaceae bacterium]
MARVTPFFTTDPTLLPLLAELIAHEPIFHRPQFASTLDDFDRLMAPDYWEVGASGRRYGRAFILQMLAENPPIDAATARWRISGQALRRLSPANETATYLLTYSLRQSDRLTRRSTLWQSTPEGWRILYHQGTVVSADEDNVSPS